jgi:hypothetical protein
MKRLLWTVMMATGLSLSLFAQQPSVSIKIDSTERFRFEGNRLNFTNQGRNVLIGDSTGYFMDRLAEGNVYIGVLAGLRDSLGYYNTFIGGQAGYSNRTGIRNTFLGFGAGQGNMTGSRNTFVGMWSGPTNTNGSYNTYIGRNTGFYNQNGSGNVFIGESAGVYELGSNMLYIANSNTSAPLIYGEFDHAYLKFNAIQTVVTGNITSYGRITANDRMQVADQPGISDTLNQVTNVDFTNNLLKYKTQIFKGGILVYTSNESEWVGAVGDPIEPCGQISLIGEFSGWSIDQPLARSESNPDVWTTTMYLSSGSDFMPQDGIVEMKFRENYDWAMNWGNTSFPSGYGILDGPNIPVPLNTNFETTVYNVTFNCRTGEYSFTDVSQ